MSSKSPFTLIILLGLVSLFSDFTYEGARSIIGPYLATLGVSATLVGFVAGLGEFLGYFLRFFSGYLTDRLRKYWAITFAGYFINLFSVPALYFAKTPFQAVSLILLERTGKALRTPARDTILSYATFKIGRGKGFGIHEAMDQIGAFLGPLMVAGILYFTKDYKTAFAGLLFPALLALFFLFLARKLFPSPEKFERTSPLSEGDNFSKGFWLYALAMGIYGAGYADFALVSYHFKKIELFTGEEIALLYALAMAIDALSALIFGYLFDKKGILILIGAIGLSSLFAPFVFLGRKELAIWGIILWGIGFGAQESIIRAGVSYFVPPQRRGRGYGIFNALFGLFWFLGSTLLGILYDLSLPILVGTSIFLQLLSILLLIKVSKLSQFP